MVTSPKYWNNDQGIKETILCGEGSRKGGGYGVFIYYGPQIFSEQGPRLDYIRPWPAVIGEENYTWDLHLTRPNLFI